MTRGSKILTFNAMTRHPKLSVEGGEGSLIPRDKPLVLVVCPNCDNPIAHAVNSVTV